MDTRFRGYDKKAACNFIATAVLRCKKQHFPNINTRLVWFKFTGKPARAQARLLRLPDGGDHAGAKVGLALLLERIAARWGLEQPLVPQVAGLRFSDCRSQALRDYEQGYVKEGVGAGGLAGRG